MRAEAQKPPPIAVCDIIGSISGRPLLVGSGVLTTPLEVVQELPHVSADWANLDDAGSLMRARVKGQRTSELGCTPHRT